MTEQTRDRPWHTGEGAAKLPSTTWVVTGRLRQRERPAGREAGYVLGLAGAPVKVTWRTGGWRRTRRRRCVVDSSDGTPEAVDRRR
jgi:hypothetical protein